MSEELRKIAEDLQKHYARLSVLAAESLEQTRKNSGAGYCWSIKDAANDCFNSAVCLQSHADNLDLDKGDN
jgi:hypothetical protein